MSRLLKSSGSVGVATMISRVLGFVRESVYAAFMAVGPVADAFLYAYSIPSLFRRLLGEGALTAAFIPIFKEREKQVGEAAMWQSANAVLSALVLLCGALVVVVVVGLTGALAALPLGPHGELIVRLLRLMFPYLLFVTVAAVFIGMLNARGHYFMPALGASMLNVVMIAAVFLIAPLFGTTLETQVFGLAVGVLLAGVVQAGFQIPALRREGFRFRWVNPWGDPTVAEVVRRMAPATLGAAAYQFNVVLTQSIAVNSAPNIVSAYNYAVRLMELPQGVVGISVATYLLSELSGLAAEKKFPEFRASLREGLLQVVFINALATVLLLVLAQPMIRLLFEHGKFTPADTHLSSQALWALAPGLLLFSVNNVFVRAFYALGDTRTPMRISVACLMFNLALSFFLIPTLRQAGMGLANTTSALLNTGLLIYAFRRKLPAFTYAGLGPTLATIVAAAGLAAVAAGSASALCQRHLGVQGLLPQAITVFGAIGLSGLVYLALCWWRGVAPARDLVGLVRRRAHS